MTHHMKRYRPVGRCTYIGYDGVVLVTYRQFILRSD